MRHPVAQRTRANTAAALSAVDFDLPTPSSSSHPTLRRRAQSLYRKPSASGMAAFYSTSGRNNPAAEAAGGEEWSNLKDYLLGRVDSVEAGMRELEAVMTLDQSSSSNSGNSSSSSTSSDGYGEDEWEVVVKRKTRSSMRRRGGPAVIDTSRLSSIHPSSSPTSPSSPSLSSASPSSGTVDDTSLEHFVRSATNFLSAIRSDLPSLSSLASTTVTSPSLIQFQLSPEARLALDHFLDDHPLPDLSDLKARLDDSKRLCLARVTMELSALQACMSELVTNVSLTVDRTTSFISLSSITASPDLPAPLASMRDYFTSESDRLAQTISSLSFSTSSNIISLSTEAADSLTAGFTRVVDEAAELTTLLTASSTAAFDEASRIYHAALEGGRKRLLKYEELPQEWKNNQHILSGYRFIGIDRWGAILRSAFQFHNETINIHSHFLGFLSLIYLAIFILPASPSFADGNHWGDKAIAIVFIGAGMKCLLCSTAWHLLSGCASGGWHRGAACVDYVGISGLIAASVIGMEYYGLYCRPRLAMAYIMLSASLGVAGMIMPWKPWFNMRKYKMWRVAFFVGIALSALLPLGHMAILHGFVETANYFSPVLPSIAAYLVGLSFYANQFPECAAPGRCDTLFASHQLWHGAIVLAVWAHWRALSIWSHTPLQSVSCGVCRLLPSCGAYRYRDDADEEYFFISTLKEGNALITAFVYCFFLSFASPGVMLYFSRFSVSIIAVSFVTFVHRFFKPGLASFFSISC